MVIRSLNLLHWLGNLSKELLSRAELITHKMTEQTRWETNGNLEREMARGRAARGHVHMVSMNMKPYQPHKYKQVYWDWKTVFSGSKQIYVGFIPRKLKYTTKPITWNFLVSDLLPHQCKKFFTFFFHFIHLFKQYLLRMGMHQTQSLMWKDRQSPPLVPLTV